MQSSLAPPLITLTTDFGLADHYVGTMKGVILNRCPQARLVDICHEITAFSIYSGAYTIDQAAPYFPAGTVHVIVIDPGVGTSRKPILMKALGQYFIAPDNGVLSLVAARGGARRVWEIKNPKFWLDSPSSTFHGRDIFAPTAAALASGAAHESEIGPAIEDMELLPDLESKQVKERVWQGKLLSVDRFGNAVTNFKIAEFADVRSREFTLMVNFHRITSFQETFGNGSRDECFVYAGSSGYLEIGMNQESAARFLNAKPGEGITLSV